MRIEIPEVKKLVYDDHHHLEWISALTLAITKLLVEVSSVLFLQVFTRKWLMPLGP